MVVYSGFYYEDQTWSLKENGNLDDMWLLTYKVDIFLVYQWKLLDVSPPKLTYPSLISAFDNTIAFFYGANFTETSGRPNGDEV